MGKAILFIFIFAVITSVVMLNFRRGNIVHRQPPQQLTRIEEVERHDPDSNSIQRQSVVVNSEQSQQTAKPITVPAKEAKPLLPEGWKRVLIVMDIILNLWLLIRIRKLFNTGGDDISQRFHWVGAHDKKFYMHATKRQTGEWKPATIRDILGTSILFNGIILLITVIVSSMILRFIDYRCFFETYSLLLFIGSSLVLVFIRE